MKPIAENNEKKIPRVRHCIFINNIKKVKTLLKSSNFVNIFSIFIIINKYLVFSFNIEQLSFKILDLA